MNAPFSSYLPLQCLEDLVVLGLVKLLSKIFDYVLVHRRGEDILQITADYESSGRGEGLSAYSPILDKLAKVTVNSKGLGRKRGGNRCVEFPPKTVSEIWNDYLPRAATYCF